MDGFGLGNMSVWRVGDELFFRKGGDFGIGFID